MDLKPRIFIGSSGEGLEVAKYVKSYLDLDFDCYLWTDDIFKYNESVLETLLKEASLFDFGLLIATKDDFLQSRNNAFDVARDNVVFEYGLFLGRVGSSRAFVIQEEGTKLPSDLFGITTPRFKKEIDLSQSQSLNNELRKIRNTILEKMSLGELSLLPSTALAIGYFNNLVAITCETLCSKGKVEVNGKIFNQFEFNIVMPGDLDADIKKRAALFFRKNNLHQVPLETHGRSYPIFVTYGDNQDILKIYDMPTTLNGIDKAIEMFMRKGHIGKSAQQKLLEERELRNFQRTLQLLIDNDAYCKHIVKIIDE
ncbi:STING domain-containing protein [Mucilaginibacter sp.]|uniref:CBASS system CD-NTase-associated NAD(+) hydrolase Cap12 n=1 Tax=Mucilaginibacter sp. TaxID=1882438 RepID=UPI00261F16F4|nr:STING domain-containing protein [Mucilaginibacter sp.]MDB5032651.1 hypothetical protein [Mucilaginibacter sp.]